MKDGQLSYEDVLQIVQMINASSQTQEFQLKCGDIQIEMRKTNAVDTQDRSPDMESVNNQESDQPALRSAQDEVAVTKSEPKSQTVGTQEVSEEEVSPASIPEGAHIVKAPMVGTFYRSPEPGAPPFVEVGQRVDKDDTVCIIEVMKLFNSISAGHSGVVTHVLVDNEEPIEYGQALIVIDPNQ